MTSATSSAPNGEQFPLPTQQDEAAKGKWGAVPVFPAPGAFPVSEDTADRIFSLPMHPYLQKENQTEIAEILKNAC